MPGTIDARDAAMSQANEGFSLVKLTGYLKDVVTRVI